MAAVRAVRAHPFPQPVWTTCWSPAPAVRARERRGLPSPALPAAGERGGPGLAPGGPRTSGRAAVSRPVSMTLRRQGRAVARARGPRHHRPRLRHEAHRRGAASAASRPSQARARAVGSVCQSAQRPADRSVQPLKRTLRGWTAPALALGCQAMFWPPVGSATRSNRRCALPPRSAPQGAHKEGTGAAALCPCRWFLLTPIPLTGALRIAVRSWRSAAVPLLPLVLCGRSSLLASVWNVMPQGSCVKAWPRGAHQQDGYRGLTASEGRMACQAGRGAGGPRSQALCVPGTGGARACWMRRWRGQADRGGNVPPRPSCVAALRW